MKGSARVFAVNTKNISEELFYRLLDSLPKALANNVRSFTHRKDALLALAGKLLLKHGLTLFGCRLGLTDLKFNEYGKPYLPNEVYFNISHSGFYAVCAFSENCAIGIDIEQHISINIDEFSVVFTKKEIENMKMQQNSRTAFFDLWCAKESIMKADGRGFGLSPLSLSPEKQCFVDGKKWHLTSLDNFEEYSLFIATEIEMEKVYFDLINIE